MPDRPAHRLEERLADLLARSGKPASSRTVARELLGVRSGTEQALTRTIRTLLGARPRLVRRSARGWELRAAAARPGREAAAAHVASPPDPARSSTPRGASPSWPGPLVLAAADRLPGALRPSRLALLELDEACHELNAAQWPGTAPREIRRLARGRAVIALGGRADADAVTLWVGPDLPLTVLPSDRILRRMGRPAPRRRGRRRGRTRRVSRTRLLRYEPAEDWDPGRDTGDDDSPLARCRGSLPLAADLVERLRADGIGSWEDAHRWLEERPGFDFTGRAFDRGTLAALPEGPGVYRFFDDEGDLVYVGQSRGLRSRVCSYFRTGLSPSSRAGRIAARVHRIEVAEEGSDLAAQVREASEIRRRRPSANRQRAVRERPPRMAVEGNRVFVLPGRRGRGREVLFVRDGEIVDRRSMTAGAAARRRAEELLGRYYFGRPAQLTLPGLRAGRRRDGRLRPAISPRLAEEAGRLLASWLRRREERVLAFDPGEAKGPADAARLLAGYLRADPAEGRVFIR